MCVNKPVTCENSKEAQFLLPRLWTFKCMHQSKIEDACSFLDNFPSYSQVVLLWNLIRRATEVCKQVVIDFGLASDWLRKWHKFYQPITEPSRVKPKANVELFRHSIENCSYLRVHVVNIQIKPFHVVLQVKLVESAWRVGNASGRQPTNHEMIMVLSHLTSLRIRAKWTSLTTELFSRLGDITLTVSSR